MTTTDPSIAAISLLAAFSATLLDPNGQPNLVTGSAGPNPLTWTLTNNMADSLVVTPFTGGEPGPEQYHFMFSFAPGALTAAPVVDGWDVAAGANAQGAIDTLYLALAGSAVLHITPQGSHAAGMTYTTAVQQDSGSSRVRLVLTAGLNVTAGDTPLGGREFGPIDLTLVPVGTLPLSTPPLSVDFVGRRTVLNDGRTPNAVTFALTNLTATDLALTASSVFTVWFDAAPNEGAGPYAWALARVQDLAAESVALAVPPGWAVSPMVDVNGQLIPGNPAWTLTPTGAESLPPQSPVLFTFSGIVTDLDPGITRMYLRFQGVPGFADGILVGELEKSPLIYGAARGDGLFVVAGTYEGSTPPAAPDYGGGLSVRQYGPGAAATLTGGTGLVIQDVEGLAARIGGAVGIDVGEKPLTALAVTAANAQPALSATQSGAGPAATLSGGTGLVIQGVAGPAAQSGGGVGIAVGAKPLTALAVTAANALTALSATQSGSGAAATLVGGTGLVIQGVLGHAAQIGGGVGIAVDAKPVTALAVEAKNALPVLSVRQLGSGPAAVLSGGTTVLDTLQVTVGGVSVAGPAGGALSVQGNASMLNDLSVGGNVNVTGTAKVGVLVSGGAVIDVLSVTGPGMIASGLSVVLDTSIGAAITASVSSASQVGISTNGQIVSGSGISMLTHLETRSGHRVVTSPITLEAEVHLSGAGTLAGGRATVVFGPEVEDMIAHAEGYRVQLTPTAQCRGLCVVAKRGDGFDVEEAGGGDGSAGFDWFVVARRRGGLNEPAAHALPDALPEMPGRPAAAAG